jgi:glycosyltransferase involved in cell wall biosynthesis
MNIKNDILISCVLLTYNHKDYIGKALDTILSQHTQFNFEIIVADDASTDSTLEIINEYAKKYPSRIKPIFHQYNVGTTKNLTDALRACKGDFITVNAGDDCWIDNSRIEKQASFLIKNDDYIGISNSYSINRNGKIISHCASPYAYRNGNTMKTYLNGNGFLGHSTMFRNIFFGPEAEQLFNHIESSRLVEDISLSMIILDKGDLYFSKEDVAMYFIRSKAANYNSVVSNEQSYIQHINSLNANLIYFQAKYDLTKLYSMRATITLIRAIMNIKISFIPTIYKSIPGKIRAKCIFRIPIDCLKLIRYKTIGHF